MYQNRIRNIYLWKIKKCTTNKTSKSNLILLTKVEDAWIHDEISQMVNAQADCWRVYYIHNQ